MIKEKLALVTDLDHSQPPDGEALLLRALAEDGYSVNVVPWEDKTANWKSFDIIIFRSCWNYPSVSDDFTRFLDRLKFCSGKVFNPINTVRWNINKNYLLDLQGKGMPVIPTVLLDRDSKLDLDKVIESVGYRVVLKPIFGTSAHLVEKVELDNSPEAEEKIKRRLDKSSLIIQRYMPEISDGEHSLIFFNREFSHAVLKKPDPNDFRTQPDFGGAEEKVRVDRDLITQGEKIISSVSGELLYARVDGLVINGVLTLMELELVEPYLFFEQDPKATERFIDALKQLTR